MLTFTALTTKVMSEMFCTDAFYLSNLISEVENSPYAFLYLPSFLCFALVWYADGGFSIFDSVHQSWDAVTDTVVGYSEQE